MVRRLEVRRFKGVVGDADPQEAAGHELCTASWTHMDYNQEDGHPLCYRKADFAARQDTVGL